MQSIKLRSAFHLTPLHRDYISFVRTVAVNATSVKDVELNNLKPMSDIPGPSSLPIIGQMHNFLPGGKLYNLNGTGFTKILYKTYGPLVKLDPLFGRPAFIFCFDAESSAQVLRSENWLPRRPGFPSLEYYRKKHNKPKEHTIKPTGLLTDHGDPWKEFRSTVNPVMLQPKTIKLYNKVLDEVAIDMIGRMRSIRDEKYMIQNDLDIEMNKWALESIGVVAFGDRLNCFDSNLAEDSTAKKLIQCVHDIFQISEQLDFKPNLSKYYATSTFKKGMKIYEEQENLAKYFIDNARIKFKTNPTKSEHEKGILEKLLEINEDFAVIMASDMLLAGVDTAANTIITILYQLATHPEKQDKLREELNSGDEKRAFLKACHKESMRLMPIVSGNMRETTKEYNVLGYKIPKGIQFVTTHQDMSISEEFYPRPMEFIPERWLADKSDPLYYGNAHPFAYQPFGFGVRSCIGRRIAELEIQTFLARLIENFKFEWFGPPLKIFQTAINYAKPPYNFIIKDV